MNTLTENPATSSRLPADILGQIFLLCIPDFPLDDVQPNTSIAPMKMCHVCSWWRTVALDTPSLWSYLHFWLPIRWDDRQPIAWDLERFVRDIEFLRWWKSNGGPRFISFRFYQPEAGAVYEELPLTPDIIHFFIDYLSPAEHLDVERFGEYLLQQDTSTSGAQIMLPNLRSLVTSHFLGNLPRKYGSGLPPLPSIYFPPTLRRLCIHHVELKAYSIKNFVNLSGITHLSLKAMYMLPRTWYSLIRSVPSLQWGFFDIFLKWADDPDPPPLTLPFLSTLSIKIDNSEDGEPLAELLGGLYLPALRDLTLYIDADPVRFPIVVDQMNAALRLAPNVEKFTLGLQFYGFDPPQLGEYIMSERDWVVIQKLPAAAPYLTHLVIDLTHTRNEMDYDRGSTIYDRALHWTQFLPSRRWLDLTNPRSAIQKITVVVQTLSVDRPLVEPLFLHALGMEASHVELEFVEEDILDLSPDGEGWKMYGGSVY